MGARLVVAMGLFALQAVAYVHGTASLWLLGLCGAYLVATAAVLRWSRPARSDAYWAPGWALTLWVDLTVFGLLQTFQLGSFNYAPLFVLPVLLASVLGPLLLALGSAAFATLFLLFDAFTGDVFRPGQPTTTYVQGAITGGGLFLVALLANQLASRLGREQAQARLNRALADAEAQVNQLIVTGLSEGVMVIDARGRIWHANPAACAMLGTHDATPPYEPLQRLPAWPSLSAWARSVIQIGRDEQCEFTLPTPQGEAQHVLLRARVARPEPEASEPAASIDAVCVVFMENLRDIETRVRNEKLAAMGRVSAAVAHEIRNPLAAIAQANALLAEDALSPVQQRLIQMIGQNARRLGRTVDDILDVAKLPARPAAQAPSLPLDDTAAAIIHDWQQHPGNPQVAFAPAAPGVQVRFDPEHLRRVLMNLLDNARQHAPAGQLRVEVSTRSPATLEVWNPGPPLPAQVAQHLFEPFTSSHSRSSGLGLYLSRELCQRYRAELSHQPTERHGTPGHAFVLRFGGSADPLRSPSTP